MSEATTRTLEGPEVESQTRQVNQGATQPSYLPPSVIPHMPAPATSGLGSKGNNRAIWLLVSLVGVLLIAMVAIGVLAYWRASSVQQSATPKVTVPRPPIPEIPMPPMPPPPPPAPGVDPNDSSTSDSELAYPGAEVVMDMDSDEGKVLQLRTSDPIDKVVAWYMSKLKPTKNVRVPGGTTILRAGNIVAVITGGEDETSIVIKQGGD